MRFPQIFVCLTGLAACQASSFAASISAQPAHNDFAPFAKAIEQFGGQTVDPKQFANDLNGFQQYLNASGVRSVDARELTHPNHPKVAAKYGLAYFLPPQAWWPRGAALALLAQQVEQRVGETVSVRNWWRPPVYNRDPRVGGAEKGDHIGGFGMDLDYNSSQARRRAEQWLRGLASSQPWLRLSLGLGDRTTHIGVLSPRGSREWHYASYPR